MLTRLLTGANMYSAKPPGSLHVIHERDDKEKEERTEEERGEERSLKEGQRKEEEEK